MFSSIVRVKTVCATGASTQSLATARETKETPNYVQQEVGVAQIRDIGLRDLRVFAWNILSGVAQARIARSLRVRHVMPRDAEGMEVKKKGGGGGGRYHEIIEMYRDTGFTKTAVVMR